jgi:pyruvate/2-oxoglutarate/acetoin dehydrogenase E1 component
MRKISYVQAINEALTQLLVKDDRLLLIGQGVNSPWYVGNTTKGLIDQFGPERIIDTPVSENGMTGVAVGAALAGMHPVLVFPRMDFMYYAMDQIANHAANWHYMFGGQLSVPLTIWAIINRGGEQAAQHSQALQAIFAHLPGTKVVMPATPYDAKGLLTACIEDKNPVVYIDDRWLYNTEGDVPCELYSTPIGQAQRKNEGRDITIVANSFMVLVATEAVSKLKKAGIDAELIDLRTIKPLDEDLLLKSIKKTGKLVIIDGGWKSYGIGAEIAAFAVETAYSYLKSPIKRVSLPDTPAPASRVLEKAYYPGVEDIIEAVQNII